MKMTVKLYWIVSFFLSLSLSAFSQNVYLDFTKDNYSTQLDYQNRNIVKLKRKYFRADTTDTPIPRNLETSVNFSVPVTILKPAFFNSANFKCQTDFSDITIKKWIYFEGANFDSLTTFFNSFFNSVAFFNSANFHSIVDFNGTHFLNTANFFDVHFFKLSRFDDAEFNSDAVFYGSTFDSFANFMNTDFSSVVDFTGVRFNSSVSFESAHFGIRANFNNASFGEKINMSNLSTSGNTQFNFDHCVLPDTIDISNNNSDTSLLLDFTSANFFLRFDSKTKKYRKHFINIYNTDVTKFKIDYVHFKLSLPNYFSYNEKLSLYEKLRQNFLKNEQTEDIEILNKEIKEFKWAHLNFAQKFLQIFSDPLNVLIFTVAFWLIFTAVNFFLLKRLNNEVFNISFFEQDFPYLGNKSFWRKFGIKLFYSFAYTSIIYFSFRLDIGKIRFYNRALLFWFGFIYSIGCLNLFLLAHLLFKN